MTKMIWAVVAFALLTNGAAWGGEVCSVYVNTGPQTVLSDGNNFTLDHETLVNVPIPAGATGIIGWKLGTEFPPDAKLRALMFIQWEPYNDFNHFASRVPAQEATFLPAGDHVHIPPGFVLQLRFRAFNEGDTPVENVRGNLWVWFKMGGS